MLHLQLRIPPNFSIFRFLQLLISLGRVKGGNDGPQISIEHNRATLQMFCQDGFGRVRGPSDG